MEQTERQLVSLLSEITTLYDVPMREAKARQDALAKPPGSLGLLEDLSVQLAGITGHIKNEVSHTRIYVLAADNGVVCEGVSSAPQSVTRAQAINLTRGLTGASCLAKHFGDELVVADMHHLQRLARNFRGDGGNLFRGERGGAGQRIGGIAGRGG